MNISWSRRQFLMATGTAASAAAIGYPFLRPTPVLASGFTRRDVGNLTASNSLITSYAKAVTAMLKLPPSDPRSWAYQAGIHASNTPCPCPTAWNSCEHGTEFFWSWHRMYLYYFEKIVRQMSGDSGWALPYWNWQLESKLPPMFMDRSSVLYTPNRDPYMNAGSGSLPPFNVDCTVALGDLDYASAVQDIQIPHGHVHIGVGGWMRDVRTSAQDPIFYFHHSNVDRLWDIWLAQGGGRTDPIADSAWKGKSYTFFDENGHAVTMSDCDVLRAAQELNYVYEGEPAQVNEYCLTAWRVPPWRLQIVEVIHFRIPPIEINSAPVTIPLELGNLAQRIQTIAASSEHKLFVAFEDVEAATQPGVTYQVYLGVPATKPAEPTSPYYVGTFSLFGIGVRDEAHGSFTPARFRFPANRAVTAALRQEGKLTLTIIPSGILVDGRPTNPKAAAAIHIGSIGLTEGTQTLERVR